MNCTTTELPTNRGSSVSGNDCDAGLDFAAAVQRRLLPSPDCCLAGWSAAFAYEPAWKVSGDYVDLIETGQDEFFFALGDVSGKGVAAAMLMERLHATLRVLLSTENSLEKVVRETSRSFCHNSLSAQFATLVVGRANRAGQVSLINAGHTPVFLIQQNSTMLLPATGLPLGLFCETEFQLSELTISSGATLFFYSDGITETVRCDGTEYGTSRLQTLLEGMQGEAPEKMIDSVLHSLREEAASNLPEDDRSMLALRFL